MSEFYLPKDLNKIIFGYALNNLENIDLNRLRQSFKSFHTHSRPFQVIKRTQTGEFLRGIKNFDIKKIRQFGDELEIVVDSRNSKYVSSREPLSCVVLKQMFKSLFSIHGMKCNLKCPVIRDNTRFIIFASNITKNTYEEIYIPQDIFMERENRPTISRHKYGVLSNSIIDTRVIEEIKEIFDI